MGPKFKIGEIVVIQNQAGDTSIYNGMEVSILSIPDFKFVGEHLYEIDLLHPSGKRFHAIKSHLRRRDEPKFAGEDMIRAMFDVPPVDRRQPVTAWQAGYNIAQAFNRGAKGAALISQNLARSESNFRSVPLNSFVEFVKLNSSRSHWMSAVHSYRTAMRFLPEFIDNTPASGLQIRLKFQKYTHFVRFEMRKYGVNTLPVVLKRIVGNQRIADNGAYFRPSFRAYGFLLSSFATWLSRRGDAVYFSQFLAMQSHRLNHCVNQRSSLPLLLTRSTVSSPNRRGDSPHSAKRVSPKCRHWLEQLSIPQRSCEGKGKQKPNAYPADESPSTAAHRYEFETHCNSLSLHFGIVA